MKIYDKILAYCKKYSSPDEGILDELSEFTFENMNVLNEDSSIYRVVSDCNQDGEWTAAETIIMDYNGDVLMCPHDWGKK